jgi:hypothetical protein
MSLHYDWTGTAKLELLPNPVGLHGGQYQLKSGSVTVDINGTDAGGCTFSGSQTVTLTPDLDSVLITLLDDPPSYEFHANLASETVKLTYSGCEDPPDPVDFPLAAVQLTPSVGTMPRDPSATTLEGTLDPPSPPGLLQYHFHWHIGL